MPSSITPDPTAPQTAEREARKARFRAKIVADAEATHWRRLGIPEPTAEQIWAERDRRVAALNARTDAHNKGDHSQCGPECDVTRYSQAGTQ